MEPKCFMGKTDRPWWRWARRRDDHQGGGRQGGSDASRVVPRRRAALGHRRLHGSGVGAAAGRHRSLRLQRADCAHRVVAGTVGRLRRQRRRRYVPKSATRSTRTRRSRRRGIDSFFLIPPFLFWKENPRDSVVRPPIHTEKGNTWGKKCAFQTWFRLRKDEMIHWSGNGNVDCLKNRINRIIDTPMVHQKKGFSFQTANYFFFFSIEFRFQVWRIWSLCRCGPICTTANCPPIRPLLRLWTVRPQWIRPISDILIGNTVFNH